MNMEGRPDAGVNAGEAGARCSTARGAGQAGSRHTGRSVFPAEKVAPKLILPTLLLTHFEILTKPSPAGGAVGEKYGMWEKRHEQLIANRYGPS
jgi:hypothetical protein